MVCMLLCCAAEKRLTFYEHDSITNMLKLRGASHGLQACILKMLAIHPDSRYSMHQALCDPWLLKASKPDSFATSSYPPPTSPPHLPSHAPPGASNASKRAANKPAVKAVFSPRKTRAGTRIGTQASTMQATKADPVPLEQHAIKSVNRKAQMPIHADHPSASFATGVY